MKIVELPISRGLITLIDEVDLEAVSIRRWHAHPRQASNGGFYAITQIAGKTTYLHRFLLGAVVGQLVDHANGDGLDNRRCNIRFATAAQNSANRVGYSPASGYRGVYVERNGRWVARLFAGGRSYRGGMFDRPEEAARRYDEMARVHFGEFAQLNFARAA